MTILHFSHTDIRTDSRILKELDCIRRNYKDIELIGIGVSEITDSGYTELFGYKIISLKSFQVRLFLPKIAIHIFSVISISFKMFIKGMKIRPHVIHCHDTSVLPIGVILGIINRSVIIYDAHELESDRNGLDFLSSRLTFIVEKLLWKFVNRLIVVSPSISDWYNDKMGKKPTQIILNSPQIVSFNTECIDESSYFRNLYNIPDNSLIFLYIGIIGRGRGIELILDVFLNNNLTSHVVFLGFGEMQDEIIKYSRSNENVHFHESVSHEKVVSLAKSADVGLCLVQNVSLSDYFCLPNKLFEYAFAGLPVLASKFPDIELIVNEYGLGICCDLTSECIHSAILYFEAKDELPKVNLNMLYDLSWEAQEVKLLSLYEEII